MILYGDMIFNNISVSNMYIVSATRLPLESNRICLLNYVLRSFSIRKKNVKQTRSLAVNPNIKIAFTCLANILGLALDELSTGEAFPAKTTTGIRATECNRYQQMLIGPTGIHATGWFAIDPTSCRTSACSAYWTPCFCHFSTFDADQLGWPK